MSLAQYLALGKSIENVNGDGRYKVTDQPLVPDFTGGRPALRKRPANPEVPGLFAPTAPTSPPALVAPPTLPRSESPAEPAVIRAPRTRPAEPARPQRRWFGIWGRNQRRAERQQAVAIQRELALEMVRPVRNTLIDSDLEVIPVRTQAPVKAPEQPASGAWRRWMRGLWNRVRGRG